MNIKFGSFALCLAFLLTSCGTIQHTGVKQPSSKFKPDVSKLTPPEGQPFLTLEAKGNQIFRCTRDTQGAYWKIERPQASLFNKSGEKVAEHEGPMQAFQHQDGSRILSTKIERWVNPANPKKDLKYALLSAVSDPGTGTFNNVKYVQRIDCVGGMPLDGCKPDEAGKIKKVPFTATYIFWK